MGSQERDRIFNHNLLGWPLFTRDVSSREILQREEYRAHLAFSKYQRFVATLRPVLFLFSESVMEKNDRQIQSREWIKAF